MALSLAVLGQASAQHPMTQMGGFIFSAWAGGAANTDLQRVLARAEWQDADGESATRSFSRRLGAEPTFAVGMGAAYWFSPRWGVRLQASLSPSQLGILVSERETREIPRDEAATGPTRFGLLRVWTFDGQLLLRTPVTPRGRVATYGLLGLSRVEYDLSTSEGLPPEALVFVSQETPGRFALVAGLGASVPLHRERLALGFELNAHVSRTPVQIPGQGRLTGEVVEVITPAGRGRGEVQMTGHFRMLVGLSWFVR